MSRSALFFASVMLGLSFVPPVVADDHEALNAIYRQFFGQAVDTERVAAT